MIDLETIKQLAQLLGANPAILIIGYLVLRKIDTQHETTRAALDKVKESLETIGGQLINLLRDVAAQAGRPRA